MTKDPAGTSGRIATVNILVNGATVQALRKVQGLNLKDLAEASGLSISYICEVEKGTKRNLRPATMKKLAEGLGVSIPVLARDPEAAQAFLNRDEVA